MKPGTRAKVHGPEYVSAAVEVRGLVAKPGSFTVSDLRALPVARESGFSMLCGSGKLKDGPRDLEGASLVDVLDAAEVILAEHESPNRTFVVATGSDGYFSVFTWHEIFNTPAGSRMIIAYSKDGAPLGEDEGRLCLIAAGDDRQGPRRVRYLKTIEVREILA